MAWLPLTTQAEADALMWRFGGFHDGCIRELHLWTGHWVNPDLSMNCTGDLDTNIRIVVQRQAAAPSAIELLFHSVTQFTHTPTPPNCDSIISGATLVVGEDAVYWSSDDGWSPGNPPPRSGTVVAAKRAAWREVNEWLGKNLHLGPGPVEWPA